MGLDSGQELLSTLFTQCCSDVDKGRRASVPQNPKISDVIKASCVGDSNVSKYQRNCWKYDTRICVQSVQLNTVLTKGTY